MSENYWIYKITNNINKKVYIGQSIHYKRRWNEHINNAKKGRTSRLYLDIREYGVENFSFEVIDIAESREQADYKEGFYASYYDSYNEKKGYNERGCGLHKFLSENTKKKISISREKYKGVNGTFYGKHHTEETKKKISRKLKEITSSSDYKNAFYGKKHTDNTRSIMSEKAKKRSVGENNNMYGKHHTDAAKKKMSEKWTDERKEKLIESQRKTCQCVETGEIFESYKEASYFVNCSPSAITKAINSGRAIKGYHFIRINCIE